MNFTVPSHSITLHAVWLCTHITTAEDLIELSKNVNSGLSYLGITVFLDADIDFSGGLSESFEHIGKNDNYFQGTFYGQGHTISNLAIESSLKYVGLFGKSNGGMLYWTLLVLS